MSGNRRWHHNGEHGTDGQCQRELDCGSQCQSASPLTGSIRCVQAHLRGHYKRVSQRTLAIVRQCSKRTLSCEVDCQCRGVGAQRLVVEADETDQLDCGRRAANGVDSDPGGRRDGVAVHTGRDCRKGDRAGSDLVGSRQRFPVARRQQLGFALVAAVPDRPDRVYDPGGSQPETGRDLGLTGRAAAERPAKLDQLRPCGAVDGTVNAAPLPTAVSLAALTIAVDRVRP